MSAPAGPTAPATLRLTLLAAAPVLALAVGLGASGVLPGPPALPAAAAGLAVVLSLLGNLPLAAALRSADGGRALFAAVVADLVLHLVVGGGTVAAVFVVGEKFTVGATFALVFAGAAVILRVSTAVLLARATRPGGVASPRS